MNRRGSAKTIQRNLMRRVNTRNASMASADSQSSIEDQVTIIVGSKDLANIGSMPHRAGSSFVERPRQNRIATIEIAEFPRFDS